MLLAIRVRVIIPLVESPVCPTVPVSLLALQVAEEDFVSAVKQLGLILTHGQTEALAKQYCSDYDAFLKLKAEDDSDEVRVADCRRHAVLMSDIDPLPEWSMRQRRPVSYTISHLQKQGNTS